jgi:uncharacterized protein (TIGR00369 family)
MGNSVDSMIGGELSPEHQVPAPFEHGIALHDLLDLRFEPPPPGSTTSRVSMPVSGNALGLSGLHGGALATMIDFGAALTAARAIELDLETESLVTSDMHVRYLAAARGAWVHADSVVIRIGSQIVVVTCTVTDSNGSLVASADASFMRVPKRQPAPPA